MILIIIFVKFPWHLKDTLYLKHTVFQTTCRSTVEFHSGKYAFKESSLPSVVITICTNDTDFGIRSEFLEKMF